MNRNSLLAGCLILVLALVALLVVVGLKNELDDLFLRTKVLDQRAVQLEQAVSMPAPTNAPQVQAPAVQPTSPTSVRPTAKSNVQVASAKTTNGLTSPVLHHADSQPPENGVGSFDVGVHKDQVGLAFGWHIAWPKGGVDAGGGGCNLVILTPGWYENLQVTDGRYEVYDVPSSDYDGWARVLGQQRADEQAKDYGCPAKSFQDIPQWESPIPSPP